MLKFFCIFIFTAERAPIIKLDKFAFEADSGKPYTIEVPYESNFFFLCISFNSANSMGSKIKYFYVIKILLHKTFLNLIF